MWFLRVTLGKGLHTFIPFKRTQECPDAIAFCPFTADLVVKAPPDRYVANTSKAERRGKIFSSITFATIEPQP